MRGGDVSKRNLKEFTIEDLTYLDSQLKIGWTGEKCNEMDKLAQENYTCRPSSEEYERYKKKVYLAEHVRQKCTDETPIRFPNSSHINEPSSP